MFYVDENKRAVFSTSRSFPIIIHETNLRDKPLGYNSFSLPSSCPARS